MLTSANKLEQLNYLKDNHTFWNNKLLRSAQSGHLTIDDYRYIWGQYFLYSQNFTRYLAGVMAACDSDYYRARLSENVWEEGGGCEPASRHSELFRQFLRRLALTPEQIEYAHFTQLFVQQYLHETNRPDSLWSTAFLSLGTEAIVPRMYEIFIQGMLKAGLPNDWLHFFHLHVACDDEHARTLAEMLCSFSQEPGWFERSARAIEQALLLRANFFEALYAACLQRRVANLFARLQARQSLYQSDRVLHQRHDSNNQLLYTNENQRLNIQFTVEKLPFQGEVLDPRWLQIPVGKNNERHRHAHETLFYIVQGRARIAIDEHLLVAESGDTVFIPRWSVHQSHNIGDEELIILAVTDFGLTGKYLGNYDGETRLKKSPARPSHFAESGF